jgi:hypothetical protein
LCETAQYRAGLVLCTRPQENNQTPRSKRNRTTTKFQICEKIKIRSCLKLWKSAKTSDEDIS